MFEWLFGKSDTEAKRREILKSAGVAAVGTTSGVTVLGSATADSQNQPAKEHYSSYYSVEDLEKATSPYKKAEKIESLVNKKEELIKSLVKDGFLDSAGVEISRVNSCPSEGDSEFESDGTIVQGMNSEHGMRPHITIRRTYETGELTINLDPGSELNARARYLPNDGKFAICYETLDGGTIRKFASEVKWRVEDDEILADGGITDATTPGGTVTIGSEGIEPEGYIFSGRWEATACGSYNCWYFEYQCNGSNCTRNECQGELACNGNCSCCNQDHCCEYCGTDTCSTCDYCDDVDGSCCKDDPSSCCYGGTCETGECPCDEGCDTSSCP